MSHFPMAPRTRDAKAVKLGIIDLANYCYGVSNVTVFDNGFGLGAYAA